MTENMSEFVDKKKAHRSQHSGRKAEKKKEKKSVKINENLLERQRNPRAFAFNSAIGAERRFRRKQDIETKKQHIPFVDRTPIEPPPILIVVVGPPKVGKSTLINNLVKLFSKSQLTDIKGPVTIVIGKKRRITLMECNNDINSMIDLAKVADLVLLLCDASFGFEMEIFEFLNICQVHGMPKIMGILTHLDIVKNSKTLKNIKKSLKHRFWTEIYPGAKLFYLSGIVHGEYLRNEIRNLGRFISIMKFRPLTWRMTHSYLLGDRYEDLTNLELIRQNPKCDRNISLYGYVRGIPLNNNTHIHIAGLGDLKIHNISYLPDPCPLPETLKKRTLVEKEKLVYAPFSGVGGIVYDKDAVYVELGGSHSYKIKDDDKTNNIITNLIGTKETLDIKMKYSELQLFTTGNKLTADDIKDLNQNSNVHYNCLGNGELLQTNKKIQDDVNLNNELEDLRNQSRLKEEMVHCDSRIRRKVIFPRNDRCNDNITSDNETMQSEELEYATTKNCKDKNIHLKVSSILNTFEKLENHNIEIINNDNWSHEIETDVDSEVYSDKSVEKEQQNSRKNTIDNILIGKTNEVSNKDNEIERNTDYHDMALKWKENLLKKAEENYLVRLQTNKSLMKIVYGVFDEKLEHSNMQKNDENESDEIGGLFRIISHEQQKQKIEKDSMDLTESSLSMSWVADIPNYTNSENKWMIEDCFVTGKWKKSEDASELLKLDAEDISSELYEHSNFEDLETAEKLNIESDSQKRKRCNEEMDREMLVEKKLKLKQKFDSEYDNTEGSYYDALKLAAEKQAQLNKSVFENIHDDVRVQIEGYRPGMYVRIEFQNVSSDFVTNFDPTYPIVIGGLNMGEENIGYVNVKMKKHRWYNKILKANDPLIVSLGWRRFQTLPLYSKLEDDLKFRYLKYTPEHLSCNAHFWGPITPQGTGFLAIQTCEANPEIVKQQGFRIAATGAVQDLDKSTKIMKKLKLVGYPMKIYKKTAFIKGMFNSSLEVAKFEGARIKTVSGIRGQIKKVVSKPEGCFRATFEDKILLSDIVFCRTWYKVDVQQFYTPVTTLLLPPASKTSWKGIKTTGELKRELEIKKPANKDNLYSEIVREAKVFKPLIIPKKLQQGLPYRDKPHHGIKSMENNKRIDRVAVIKEPYEQKVSKIIKMIRTTYDHKQQQLKKQTKERLEKHRLAVQMVEANKAKKLKKQKKNIFRIKSKMQLKEQKETSMTK